MTDSRFSSIGGILSRRDTTTPGSAESGTAPPAHEGTVTRIGAATPGGRTRPPEKESAADQLSAVDSAPASSEQSSGGTRRVVFRIDPELHRCLGERAAAEKTSYGQLVLDAVESLHTEGRLREALAATATSTPGDGLFPRLRTRADAQPAVSVQVRLDARAVDILDKLVDELDADNRTHLMVTALRSYLQ